MLQWLDLLLLLFTVTMNFQGKILLCVLFFLSHLANGSIWMNFFALAFVVHIQRLPQCHVKQTESCRKLMKHFLDNLIFTIESSVPFCISSKGLTFHQCGLNPPCLRKRKHCSRQTYWNVAKCCIPCRLPWTVGLFYKVLWRKLILKLLRMVK